MSLDTRSENIQSLVRNQGRCGSCWAMVVAYAVEQALLVQQGQMVEVSVERIMEDSKLNQGCKGGDFSVAIREFLREGVMVQVEGSTRQYSDIFDDVVTITDNQLFSESQVSMIKMQLDRGNPVAGAMSVKSGGFIQRMLMNIFYGNIISGGCSKELDHQVLFAGYGKFKGKEVWILKNTWGGQWGNYGYFYTEIGKNSLCVEKYAVSGVLKQGVRRNQGNNGYYGFIERGRNGLDRDDDSFEAFRRTGSLSIMEAFVFIFLVASLVGSLTGIYLRMKKNRR